MFRENCSSDASYETLGPSVPRAADKGLAAAGPPDGAVPPPAGGTSAAKTAAPNICIEGGRIEFVKWPADRGDEKQDCLKVSAAESAKRITRTRYGTYVVGTIHESLGKTFWENIFSILTFVTQTRAV